MFERELAIAGIRTQCNALKDLVDYLEHHSRWDDQDLVYCGEIMKKVENGLRRLRSRQRISLQYSH